MNLLGCSKLSTGFRQRCLRLRQSNGGRTVSLVTLNESNEGCERQRDASQVEHNGVLPIVSVGARHDHLGRRWGLRSCNDAHSEPWVACCDETQCRQPWSCLPGASESGLASGSTNGLCNGRSCQPCAPLVIVEEPARLSAPPNPANVE
eukprot:5957230-Prymnesium_polylepis.1